ncbi:MAG: division/cell wall cluster transcriptional repressor MraZ [Actinomycetota bacterium]
MKFYGRFEHSVDPKGRVILPAKFRAHFEQGGYLTQYHQGCLALWTPDEFALQSAAMEASQGLGPAERNLARVWAAGTQEAEVDRQGRVAIAPPLRTFAQLDVESGVLVMGAINRIELWNPARWAEKLAPTEEALIEAS